MTLVKHGNIKKLEFFAYSLINEKLQIQYVLVGKILSYDCFVSSKLTRECEMCIQFLLM